MWHDLFILGGKQVCITMTHSYIWHVSCILGGQQVCITEDMWLHTVHLWRDAYVYDWFIYACVIHTRAMPLLCMCQDPFMTHSHVWHLASLLVIATLKESIHMCDMTHSYVWHDSFICVTWLIHMCDMTHSYVWHDSLLHWRGATSEACKHKSPVLSTISQRATASHVERPRLKKLKDTPVYRPLMSSVATTSKLAKCHTCEWLLFTGLWYRETTPENERAAEMSLI